MQWTKFSGSKCIRRSKWIRMYQNGSKSPLSLESRSKPNIIESRWKCSKQLLSNFPTVDWSANSNLPSTNHVTKMLPANHVTLFLPMFHSPNIIMCQNVTHFQFRECVTIWDVSKHFLHNSFGNS